MSTAFTKKMLAADRVLMAIRDLVPTTVLKTVRERVPATMEELAPIAVLTADRVRMAVLTAVRMAAPTLVPVLAQVRIADPPATVPTMAPMQTAKAKMPAAMKTLRKPPTYPQRAMQLPLGRLLRLP